MLKSAQDFFSACFLMFFSVVIYISTNNIKSMTDMGVGPGFFPKTIAIIMFVLSFILLIQAIVKWKKKELNSNLKGKKIIQSLFKKEHLNAVITVFILISYVYLISKIGFLFSSFFYLLLHFFVLGEKRSWRFILFIVLALVVSAAVFYTFRLGFSVRLPTF